MNDELFLTAEESTEAHNQTIIISALELIKDLGVLRARAGGPVFDSITIVGGAARDLILGKSIRDVDLFLQRAPGADRDDVLNAIKAAVFLRGDMIDGKVSDALVSDVYAKALLNYGYTVDFLEMPADQPIDVLLRDFPDDLSQVYITSDGVAVMSDAFIDASGTETITIRPGYAERMQKLAAKFPEYKIVEAA